MSFNITNDKINFLVILTLIIVGILTRFIFIVSGESFLPNFTALGAIVLLSAVYLKGNGKVLVPLLALWISDMILNNVVYSKYFDSYQLFGNLWVYLAYGIIIFCAWHLMKRISWSRIVGSSILIGVIFFLITNFGVWISPHTPYPKTMIGLLECYAAGIPFFRNTILGNLFYSILLFGVYEYLLTRIPALRPFRMINV